MDASIGGVFRNKTGNAIIFVILIILVFICTPISVSAKVKGQCANCHTMHNSQDSGAVFRDGSGAGWSGGRIQGGSLSAVPAQNLLVTGCVGCHTNAETGDTIVSVGGGNIPIVYNTSGYPSQPLAGGNFYYVSLGLPGSCPDGGSCDEYGHNVWGISDEDQKHLDKKAPGGASTCGNPNSCHWSLALDPKDVVKPGTDNKDRSGCNGCHFYTYHHDDDSPYRFLTGHGDGTYVTGKEDPDWEVNPDAGHNWYKGVTESAPGRNLVDTNSISSYCAGCHQNFHKANEITNNSLDLEGPWIRHPTDIALPSAGEYSAYTYNSTAPVAWTDPLNETGTKVVMCLSCHRSHGSPYRDMLRWNYSDMMAGGGANSTGCFACHTTKDDGS